MGAPEAAPKKKRKSTHEQTSSLFSTTSDPYRITSCCNPYFREM